MRNQHKSCGKLRLGWEGNLCPSFLPSQPAPDTVARTARNSSTNTSVSRTVQAYDKTCNRCCLKQRRDGNKCLPNEQGGDRRLWQKVGMSGTSMLLGLRHSSWHAPSTRAETSVFHAVVLQPCRVLLNQSQHVLKFLENIPNPGGSRTTARKTMPSAKKCLIISFRSVLLS